MATKSGAGGLVYSVVAIAIIVLIVSTVAVPVINDAQSEIYSETQNTNELYVYAVGDSIPDVVLTFNSGKFYVNGVEQYDYSGTYRLSVITDHGYIRGNNTGVYGVFYEPVLKIQSNDTLTLTISSGVLSIDLNGTAYDFGEISYIYYPDKSGTYGYFEPTTDNSFYLDKGAIAYIWVPATYAADYNNAMVLSKYEAGTYTTLLAKYLDNASPPAVYDPMNIRYTINQTVSDDGLSMKIGATTMSYENVVGTVDRPTYWIAPISYHYVSDSDESLINLLQIIPVLLFLVPVMFAVRMIQTRRN